MTDIVERLRALNRADTLGPYPLTMEAADEIERLNEDREKYFLDNLEMRADNERLRAALQRIDGINDNPACYNPMIEEVLRAALEPKP